MKSFDVISYHPGRQHNIEQAIQLQKAFKSFKHLTSLYFDKKTIQTCDRFSSRIGTALKKRSSELDANTIDTYMVPEAKLLLKRALGYTVDTKDYIQRNNAFQQWMLRRYAPPEICIGYDTASWMVFDKWKFKSFLVLDLSIAAPQYKLTLAKEHHLDETRISNLTKDDAQLYDIYAREMALADLILCGSEFVRKSCLSLGIDAGKLAVAPYGADLSTFSKTTLQPADAEIIKVAFVGSVNYRKGADVLIQAWQQLMQHHTHIELHFYGNVQIEMPAVKGVYYHGFLNQSDLIAELRTAHISVLPTFFEGSSLAIYQSMAMGLAVITTPNAGSVIDDQRNGLLVDYGNPDMLYDALSILITEPEFRKTLAEQALQDIRQYTWDAYGMNLTAILKENVYETAYA